jgi:hypothetical protein
MAQWTLTDFSSGAPEVLTFEWNPNKFDPPGRSANITADLTTAPNGTTILFQGRDKVRKSTFEGAVGSQTFYQDLDTWKDKWYPLQLVDDQGNTWTILIEEWKWTRVKRRNPWRFDYTAQVIVL